MGLPEGVREELRRANEGTVTGIYGWYRFGIRKVKVWNKKRFGINETAGLTSWLRGRAE